MKNVEIGPIRPPSESNSLLVRVTRGCHWNKCYFCGLYKSIQFSMRPIEETIEDIAKQAQLYKGRTFTSCFLQDGDALVLKTDYLLRILDALNHHSPACNTLQLMLVPTVSPVRHYRNCRPFGKLV